MTATYEFSRLVALENILPHRDRIENLEASAEECAALAKRFDLRVLSGLKGKVTVSRASDGNFIRIAGDFEADVVQACVVSLQDVPSHVKGHFETYFTEDGKEFDQAQEEGLEEEEDLHQVVAEGMIDIGELTAQYLSLELDPYPRAPGVSLAAQMAEVGGDTKNRPFKVLEGLKSDKKDE